MENAETENLENLKNLELWKKAGKIAAAAREFAPSLVKEGALLLEVTEKIEEFIVEQGGKPAFPIQISLNNIAAHYAALPDDKTTFAAGDLVKVDVGVHVEGCVGDTAVTVEVGTKKNEELIKAAREALSKAIPLCTPGRKLHEIGAAIDGVISGFGFSPVKNLSGHGIDLFTIHTGMTIPNYDNGDTMELKRGQVIAIEPFASTGAGFVKEGKPSTIYRLLDVKPTRNPAARKILSHVGGEFKTLPFSKRQLAKKFPALRLQLDLALVNLERQGVLHHYAQLVEKPKTFVAQAEHTLVVDEKPIVLTER